MDGSPPGSSVHGDSPGKNTGEGCQTPPGDLPNPGIEPVSPALQQILYRLSHQGSLIKHPPNTAPHEGRLSTSWLPFGSRKVPPPSPQPSYQYASGFYFPALLFLQALSNEKGSRERGSCLPSPEAPPTSPGRRLSALHRHLMGLQELTSVLG